MSSGPKPTLAVGLNSDFISDQPRVLIMKAKILGSRCTVNLEDGSPLLKTYSPLYSPRRRQHLMDARSKQEVLKLRSKEEAKSRTYYSEYPSGGDQPLIEIKPESASSSANPTLFAYFSNFANGGARVQFEYTHSSKYKGTVMWDGQPIAEIETNPKSLRGETSISLAPGVDPLPVVALVLTLSDIQVLRSNAAGMGGFAAGAGGFAAAASAGGAGA